MKNLTMIFRSYNMVFIPPPYATPRTYLPKGTKRISVTLRERKETFPAYLLPVPDCRCGVPAALKARVLRSGGVEYLYQCDPGRGQCGFMLFKGPSR